MSTARVARWAQNQSLDPVGWRHWTRIVEDRNRVWVRIYRTHPNRPDVDDRLMRLNTAFLLAVAGNRKLDAMRVLFELQNLEPDKS